MAIFHKCAWEQAPSNLQTFSFPQFMWDIKGLKKGNNHEQETRVSCSFSSPFHLGSGNASPANFF